MIVYDRNKLFTWQTLLLVVIGLLVNYCGAKIALLLELPIFLDSIGTILAAALGGLLPGITVGFFSNVINSVGDPITLYYGIISILIGILAAHFSTRRVFKRFFPTLLTAFPFAVAGGVVGSLLTWMLSGLDFGTGISSDFVLSLYNDLHLMPFAAQLLGDFLIDLLDKGITVLLVFPLLKCFPKRFLGGLPVGALYVHTHAKSKLTEEKAVD